jgi:hypothetical protein
MAVHSNINDMSNKIYASMSTNGDTVTAADDIYQQCLPENLTMDTVLEVRRQDGDFIAATASAVGRYAIELMKKDPKRDEVTARFDMGGKDSTTHTVVRSKTFSNSFAKEGEPKEVTKHGVVTTTVEYQHTRNVGDLKAVKKEIADLASAAFSK